jgi:hypothetical protein
MDRAVAAAGDAHLEVAARVVAVAAGLHDAQGAGRLVLGATARWRHSWEMTPFIMKPLIPPWTQDTRGRKNPVDAPARKTDGKSAGQPPHQ